MDLRVAHLTIRARLTLLYSGTLAAAGLLLLAFSYWVIKIALDQAPERIFGPNRPIPGGVGPIDPRLAQLDPQILKRVNDFKSQTLNGVIRSSAIALVVVVILAALAGWWMAGRALSPISQITATAARVSGGALSERIDYQGPRDELKALADTFDDMLSRLDQSFDTQRRFVANASHELRTPLAVERTVLEVEMANPEASADLVRVGKILLSVHERSERLVSGLLALAPDEQLRITATTVDLAEIAASATSLFHAEAKDRDIRIQAELQPCTVEGDPDLLDQCVMNLVQNAVRHNVASGWVRVATFNEAGQLTPADQPMALSHVVVENSGPIVDPAVLPGLFEPFRRGRDRTGTGVGLGLSLVKSSVQTHGGVVTARAREEGGLLVTVLLPPGTPTEHSQRRA